MSSPEDGCGVPVTARTEGSSAVQRCQRLVADYARARGRPPSPEDFVNPKPIEPDLAYGKLGGWKGRHAQNGEMKREAAVLTAKLCTVCRTALKAESFPAERRERLLEGIAKLVHELFTPQTKAPVLFSEPDLPKGAPNGQLWASHRKDGESPAAFILRVYGPPGVGWLDAGMSMRQLRERDRILVTEFYRWRKSHQAPAALKDKLPTVKQRNERLLSSYAQAHRTNNAQRPLARELGRLQAAAARAARRNAR